MTTTTITWITRTASSLTSPLLLQWQKEPDINILNSLGHLHIEKFFHLQLCWSQVNEWDGCPGMCHMPCNYDTEVSSKQLLGNQEKNYDDNDDHALQLGHPGDCNPHIIGRSRWGFTTVTMVVKSQWWLQLWQHELRWLQEWCDMGMDSNNCWLGNYCMDIAAGGCPAMTGLVIMTMLTRVPMILYLFSLISDIMMYEAKICSTSGSGNSGSGSTCFEPYTQVSLGSISISSLFRTATALRSIATLVWTRRDAGTATTASTRYQSILLLHSLCSSSLNNWMNGFLPMNYGEKRCNRVLLTHVATQDTFKE